jgi:peroxiredoxin
MARRLQAGDPAPDFTLPLLDGGSVSPGDYRDRTLVLVFTRYLG